MVSETGRRVMSQSPPGILEVEAKLGVLYFSQPGGGKVKAQLPVLGEAFLEKIPGSLFDSAIPHEMWSLLHKMFTRMTDKKKAGHKESHVVDQKWTVPTGNAESPMASLRASVDADSGDVLEVLQKDRLGDINVYLPHAAFDYRISTSSERSVNPSALDAPGATYDPAGAGDREKHRHSYRYGPFSLDLTIVNSSSYEMELEIADTDLLAAAISSHLATPPYSTPIITLMKAFLSLVRQLAMITPHTSFEDLANNYAHHSSIDRAPFPKSKSKPSSSKRS